MKEARLVTVKLTPAGLSELAATICKDLDASVVAFCILQGNGRPAVCLGTHVKEEEGERVAIDALEKFSQRALEMKQAILDKSIKPQVMPDASKGIDLQSINLSDRSNN